MLFYLRVEATSVIDGVGVNVSVVLGQRVQIPGVVEQRAVILKQKNKFTLTLSLP